jgi:hypothetical protein
LFESYCLFAAALAAQGDTAAQQAMPTDHRRREKEVMADFIQKKREIFLVQMSLDTKRAEIRKLEERATQREEALKKSEHMLQEDAQRFDAFLKENDEKVQAAIKKAEVATKAKQDKLQEIKRLNAAIAAIRSELSKYEEQLEDCKKYKDFLDSITPPDFFEEQALKVHPPLLSAVVRIESSHAVIHKHTPSHTLTHPLTHTHTHTRIRPPTHTCTHLDGHNFCISPTFWPLMPT